MSETRLSQLRLITSLPKKGDCVLCIQDYNNLYTKGEYYRCLESSYSSCILEENKNSYDRIGCSWSNLTLLKERFVLVVENDMPTEVDYQLQIMKVQHDFRMIEIQKILQGFKEIFGNKKGFDYDDI